ncbi:hypothetical protein CLOM_g13326 [Closterium sp. NIES-68]|nr:hypothetical protein CLOM_g13326 [Closterium sp. NIES-68]
MAKDESGGKGGSKTAKPLSQLLRKDEGWKWWKEQERAWTTLKEAVKTAPLLKLPNPDEPFLLYTDWSSSGMCTVLCQEEKGTERVVAYVSRSCSPAESNYSSYEGEGLAAVWAVELFRPYLQGRKFTLVTDHQPLLWLMTNQTLKDRNARWAMHLQEFEFDVKHRPGKTLQHVDGLTRQRQEGDERREVRAEAALTCMAVALEKEGWNRKTETAKGNAKSHGLLMWHMDDLGVPFATECFIRVIIASFSRPGHAVIILTLNMLSFWLMGVEHSLRFDADMTKSHVDNSALQAVYHSDVKNWACAAIRARRVTGAPVWRAEYSAWSFSRSSRTVMINDDVIGFG